MTFREFLQTLLSIPIPRPKKPLRLRLKRPIGERMVIQPDEFLLENKRPFRFSREGAKRRIERRQQ